MIQELRKTEQAASFEELQELVFEFENVLKERGVPIKPGSDLEAACLSAISILGKQRREIAQDPREDIRKVMTNVLGVWIFLQKIVRLKDSPDFSQLVPHLHVLNEGTVGQNTPVLVWRTRRTRFSNCSSLCACSTSEQTWYLIHLTDPREITQTCW